MKSLRFYLSGLILVCLVAGCAQVVGNPPGSAGTVPTSTASVEPTITPKATITPIPPPTRRPTSESISDLLSTPTLLYVPSFTPFPTFTELPISETLQGSPLPGVFTLTPEGLKCNVDSSSPSWGMVFKPRTDFIAEWKVYNTGSLMWHQGDILFGYVSGDKLQPSDRADTALPITIYRNDKINLHVHLVSPKEPGSYVATWGLRRSNKQDFFCTFSIAISVVKK